MSEFIKKIFFLLIIFIMIFASLTCQMEVSKLEDYYNQDHDKDKTSCPNGAINPPFCSNCLSGYNMNNNICVKDSDETDSWPQYSLSKGNAVFTINLHPDQPVGTSTRGAISVADMDGNGLMDYILMTKTGDYGPGTAGIGVYRHDGSLLWYKHNINIYNNANAEHYGLPGWSAPGFSKGDIDGDSQIKIIYIKEDKKSLVVLNGKTGAEERVINLDPNSNEPGFGLCQIVNLRGLGDRDAICQGWNIDNLNIIAAFRLDTGQRLWRSTEYLGVKHGGFRAADITGNGRDEVAGAVILDHNGKRMNSWNYPVNINFKNPHFDSIFIYDVRPDIPGLEIVLLEENVPTSQNGDSVAVVNPEKIIWRKHFNNVEPQNAAIGNFDTSKSGLEIWCRSRFNQDQRPWVFDFAGNVISNWVMNDKKPADWSTSGIEVIYSIDWDGGERQYIAAKERHTEGDIAIIDPLTGDFIKRWGNKASRLYVADISGDYREELIVVNFTERKIYIYWNPAENLNEKPRYWNFNYYKRQKDNFNYYSP